MTEVGAGYMIALFCWIQAGAKKTEVVGQYQDCYKIKLQAPAIDGKANQALIAFLAKSFAVPQSHVEILQGLCKKKKRVHIQEPCTKPAWLCT
jgi:uncharacterized protein (TIGR00251 family)